MEKTYDLRGRKYVQRPLVLGQIQEFLPLIEKVKFSKGADALTIAKSLGGDLGRALAIVLLEEGKDEPEPEKIRAAMERLDERSKEIPYFIEAEQTLEVIEDFFACNRASSILERLGKMMKEISASLKVKSSTLKKFSGTSPAETSPEEKKSSGA